MRAGGSIVGFERFLEECGDYVKSRIPLTSFCMVLFLAISGIGAAQTYDVGGSAPNSKKADSSKQEKQVPASNSAQNSSDFSWGAGIHVAREARAAQDALNRTIMLLLDLRGASCEFGSAECGALVPTRLCRAPG